MTSARFTHPVGHRDIVRLVNRAAHASLLLVLVVWSAWAVAADAREERNVYQHTKAGTALIVAINDASGAISFGSGFFVDEAGLLLTNAHVIEDQTRLVVYVRDGSFFETPEVIANDPDADLAALRVPVSVTPFVLASELPDDGVSLIAVGYPRITEILQMGLTLHATVFPVSVSGIVFGQSGIKHRPTSFIQTTGPLNSGSSGGPLVRLKTGELMGMVVHTVPYLGQAKDRNGAVVGNVMLKAGINYSIPAREIREWLVAHGLALPIAPTGPSEKSGAPVAPRQEEIAPPAANAFFSTAHLLHTMAMTMGNDADLLELAVSHYRTALELQPEAAWRTHNLGLALATLGRWEDAIDSYKTALVQTPNDSVLLTDLGQALHRAKNTAQSISSYQAALRMDPCSKRARSELGMIFLETEKWQEAIAEFSRASICQPPSPFVGYHWGLALERAGRPEDALKIWEPFLIADRSMFSLREQRIVEKIQEKVTLMRKSTPPAFTANPEQTSSSQY